MGADRIETGRGLVEKKDVRVQRHGPGQTGPLGHATANLRGIIVLEPGQAHQGELQGGQLPNLGGLEFRVLGQGQADVLGQGHGAEKRSALIEDAGAAQNGVAPGRGDLPQTAFLVTHLAEGRFLEPHEHPQQSRFAAAAAPHDNEDVALVHGEIEIAHEHEITVGQGEPFHPDGRGRTGNGFLRAHAGPHTPMMLQHTVMIAVAMTMERILVTTAAVVACPTARALRPQRMPR